MLFVKKLLGETPMVYRGGGKSGAVEQQPLIAPTAPVEEASVEIGDEADKTKVKSTKESLKIPLADTSSTGLKV